MLLDIFLTDLLQVKTNIGHSEAASGLSALIKACLTVEAEIIPPTKGLTQRNPKSKLSMPLLMYEIELTQISRVG